MFVSAVWRVSRRAHREHPELWINSHGGEAGRRRSESLKRYWDSDVHLRSRFSESMKALWQDLEYRKQRARSHAKSMQRPEEIARKSDWQKSRWEQDRPEMLKAIVKVTSNPERNRKVGEASRERWADPEYRRKRVESIREVQSDPAYRVRMAESVRESRTPEVRAKISKWQREAFRDGRRVLSGGADNRYRRGWLVTRKAGRVYFRSGWEKECYKALDTNSEVESFQVEPFSIPYRFQGRVRNYFPDCLARLRSGRQILIEVRADWRFDLPKARAQFRAAQRYARAHGMEFRILSS
jgi:hypothetical protein